MARYDGNHWRNKLLKKLRESSDEEIDKLEKEFDKELRLIRTQYPGRNMGYPAEPGKLHGNIARTKKAIAMIHTIRNERQRAKA